MVNRLEILPWGFWAGLRHFPCLEDILGDCRKKDDTIEKFLGQFSVCYLHMKPPQS